MMMKAARLDFAVPNMFRGDFWRVRDYPGYTIHESWNGWACPYFEKAVADQIMADLAADTRETGGMVTISYNAELDAYTFLEQGEDGEMEVIGQAQGLDLAAVDGTKHPYSVGAFEWTWEERGIHFDP